MAAPLGVEEVRAILRDGYGLTEIPRRVVPQDGTSSASFLVELRDRRLFLKCRAAEHAGREQVRFEQDLLSVLSREGFPVASPLAGAEGRTMVPFRDRVCELSPWIEGIRFRPGEEAMIRGTGTMLARFHRITAGIERRKDCQEREDDPDRLLRELDLHLRGVDTAGAEGLLGFLREALRGLAARLPATVYFRLPQAVIHGDFHPGNVKFDGITSKPAGLFDFDWANRQERIRDVADALLFFCTADSPEGPSDIYGLTRAVGLEPGPCRLLLASYEAEWPLRAEEREALSPVMEARWLQVRIRGMRKVPVGQRLRFLDRGNLLSDVRRIREFPGTGTA